MLAMARGIEYELVMPKKFVDLSEDEMEYDGGFLNFIVGIIVAAVGIGLSILAAVTGIEALETASHIATVGGILLTAGATILVAGVATGAIKVLTTQTIKFTLKKVAGQELKDAATKAGAQVMCTDIQSNMLGVAMW